MYSLIQSKRIRGSAGEPISIPFESLTAKGIDFVRGQLVLLAAGPGTGKSAFALSLALRSQVPCMYFSADSDAFVQLSRAVSIMTKWPLDYAEERVRSGDLGKAASLLSDIPIRFDYRANPTPDDFELALKSYVEVYGDYPELIVVDNVTNVVGVSSERDDDPFAGLEGLMDYLASMARATESCVIGLHHVTGPYNDSNQPIPLSGVKGQITRVPAMVITGFKEPLTDGAMFNVSAVKNRNGDADSSGVDCVPLRFHGANMQIEDLERPEGHERPTVTNSWMDS